MVLTEDILLHSKSAFTNNQFVRNISVEHRLANFQFGKSNLLTLLSVVVRVICRFAKLEFGLSDALHRCILFEFHLCLSSLKIVAEKQLKNSFHEMCDFKYSISILCKTFQLKTHLAFDNICQVIIMINRTPADCA